MKNGCSSAHSSNSCSCCDLYFLRCSWIWRCFNLIKASSIEKVSQLLLFFCIERETEVGHLLDILVLFDVKQSVKNIPS